MDFVSPFEIPHPYCRPKFLFTNQWKPQPKGKKFPSHWSGIQEFIFLKVWSQAKLCYLGMLPKYRSVLCFESWNHERCNLMSRYLRWKTPAHNVCFTKEGCQVCYAFSLAFLGTYYWPSTKRAGETPRAISLYLCLCGIHTWVEGWLNDHPPPTSPR